MWSLLYIASEMLRDDLEKLLSQQQLATVSLLAAEINQEMDDRNTALSGIAAGITPAILGDAPTLQALLESRPVFASMFSGGIYSTGLDGVVTTDTRHDSGVARSGAARTTSRIGFNLLDRDYIAEALKGKASIGKPVLGAGLKRPVVVMSTPIRNTLGKVIGTLSGVIELGKPSFLDLITDSRHLASGTFLLVAPHSRLVVTASDRDRVRESSPAPGGSPAMNRFLDGYEGSSTFIDPLGDEVLASAKGIPAADWILIASRPTAGAFASIRAMQWRMATVMFLLSVLLTVVAWWLLRRQFTPLLGTVRKLAAMADFKQRLHTLPVTSNDEVGQLIGGFNRVLVTLGEREEALRNSHENLTRILEATQDGFWRADAQGFLLEVNTAYCRLSGYPPEALLGMRIAELEAQESAAEIAQRMQAVIAHGSALFESTHRRQDGSLWPVEVSITFREVAGEIQFFCFLRDISNRHQAKSESDKLRQAIEQSPVSVVITDLHGNIEYVNPRFTLVYGYTADEVMGRNPRILQSGQTPVETYQELWRTLAEGKMWQGVFYNRRKNGECFWDESSISAMRNGQGDATHYIAVKEDISERKSAEAALQESEAFRLAILDSMSAQIAVLDNNGEIIAVNEAWRRFAAENAVEPGKTPNHTEVGSNYLTICGASSGDSCAGSQQARAGILAVIEGRRSNFSLEYPCHSPFQQRWFTMSVTPLGGKGQGVVVAHNDISLRKEAEAALQVSEEKYRIVFEGAGDAIFVLDTEGRFLSANPTACQRLGYSLAELTSLSVVQVNRQEETEYARQRFARLLEEGEISFETVHQHKDGSPIPTGVRSQRINWAGQAAVMSICRDISEHKRHELELLEARDAAEAANRSKDIFLANMSHELRTPLSAVIGLTSLVRRLSSEPMQLAYLDKISAAGKHLNRLINDVLDLSKINAGQMTLETTRFSLRRAVRHCTSVIGYKADEKGLQLVERIAEEVPDVLAGDSLRLEQILLNLLSNAIKFTTQGRVELEISVHAREAERVCLNIKVDDTGIGLSDGMIGQLFKPFSQGDVSITRKFGGTGLGLAICKQLAELMGGGISVSSREGHGSTFSVQVWLGLGQDGELPVTEARMPESKPVNYRNVRILVVDDQPFIRDVVVGLLGAVGISPNQAINGREALDILTRGSEVFDLVLMDVQMPVMDGLAATREIRRMSRFAALPLIAMSANTMPQQSANSIEAGMNDQISKPFDEAGFYRMLEKWIPLGKHVAPGVDQDHPAPGNRACGMPLLHGVDVRAGLALLQGNEASYRQWLGLFTVQAPRALAKIRSALATDEPEPASMAAHTLKGSTGLLGMHELHASAAALETAIDSGVPTGSLVRDLERGISAMCAEIQSKLGLEGMPPAGEAAPGKRPPGRLPACLRRLVKGLEAGDGECERAITECLDELKDSAWVPHLRRAQIHVLNFDFAAAILLFSSDDN